ncbi:MAG: MCE family protein [Muribaculaceae bacterium]|nr:MCE family protein [Muribaculaceae bacterium]
MKKLAKREIGIGVSVIVAILILIFGIEFLKGINLFRPANFYMAYYDNVDGLDISAPVKVNGFKVGQVREINFNYEKPGKTEVVLALNKNLHLPVDSRATITSSLMGEAYIEIDVGTSPELIPVGGEVATSQGRGLLDGLSDSLMPKVNETLTIVDSLLLNLNTVVSDPSLRLAMGNLSGISDNIMGASVGLNSLMNRQVPALMNNANGIVGSFGNVMTRVDTISGNLAILSHQLADMPLSETMKNLNATVANLEAFSSQLKNQNSTLGLLMNDPELYNRLNSVAASVDSLIVDIKRNPKRYISIKLL